MSPLELISSSKRRLDRWMPWAYRPFRAVWHRINALRFNARYRRITRIVVAEGGWAIRGGPFRGVEYIGEARSSAMLPKLFGTYELEVAAEIEQVIAAGCYRTIIDIGCAEGYYAVGLAKRCPESTVHAYDLDASARSLCGRMAARNGVADRVDVRGAFDERAVASVPVGERVFVICDVDGYEVELFKPDTAAAWRDADLLVELHDMFGLPCREVVTRVFSESHTVETIDSKSRDLGDAPSVAGLSDADRLLCVNELRPLQQWAILRSRRHLHG